MIFRHTIINNFFLSFPKSPIILLTAILNKNLPLSQRRQNIETSYLSSGWQATIGKNLMMRLIANVGPTSAKSADHMTNSQRRSSAIWVMSAAKLCLEAVVWWFTKYSVRVSSMLVLDELSLERFSDVFDSHLM